MENEPKQDENNDKVRQNHQALREVYDLIVGWDKEFLLMLIPSIPVKDLDVERDLVILQYIIRLGTFVLMMLSRIQTFCATLLISSRPPQRNKPEPYFMDKNKMNVLKNLTVKQRLANEFNALKKLSVSLKGNKTAFNSTIEDFRVPKTMNPDATIQEFVEKLGSMLFYFSFVQGKISQMVSVYQQFLSKECTYSLKRPNPPDSVIPSGKRLEKNTNDM